MSSSKLKKAKQLTIKMTCIYVQLSIHEWICLRTMKNSLILSTKQSCHYLSMKQFQQYFLTFFPLLSFNFHVLNMLIDRRNLISLMKYLQLSVKIFNACWMDTLKILEVHSLMKKYNKKINQSKFSLISIYFYVSLCR